jgi:hypothetical protein
LAWAGIAEWARSWLLVNRREKYTPGTGIHRLWCSIGGSAGHSGLYGLNIDEGAASADEGRRWEVDVLTADEARQEHQDGQKAAKQQRRAGEVAECQELILGAMNAIRDHREVLSRIREATGRKGKVFDEAFATLVRTGKMRQCKIQRANGQEYDGYERVYRDGKPPEKDMANHQEELSLGHSADSLGDPAD